MEVSSGDDGVGALSSRCRTGTTHVARVYPASARSEPILERWQHPWLPDQVLLASKSFQKRPAGSRAKLPRSQETGSVHSGKPESPTGQGGNTEEKDGEKTQPSQIGRF